MLTFDFPLHHIQVMRNFFKGRVQENEVAPALWIIISIFLIRLIRQQKLVTAITSPI